MNPVEQNGAVDQSLAAECQRLRETISHLQRERQQDQKRIEELTSERDDYLRGLYAWSRSLVSKEELEQWAQDIAAGKMDHGYSFEEIMASLPLDKEN